MNQRNRNKWSEEFEAVRRQRGGHGGHGGPPPWVGQMFGPGGIGQGWMGGPGGQSGRGRGPRVRRGDVRGAILDVLAAESMNGYQVIQQIAEKSGGGWKPSPGSVYPTIAQLEDEGLVETGEAAGKKVLNLTEEGRAYVAANPEEMAAIWKPFEEGPDAGDATNLKQVIGQTMSAVWQIASTGTPDQRERAAEILADTRRRLYGVLADGPEAAEEE